MIKYMSGIKNAYSINPDGNHVFLLLKKNKIIFLIISTNAHTRKEICFYSLSINSLAVGGSGLNPFLFLISGTNVPRIDFGIGVHALK